MSESLPQQIWAEWQSLLARAELRAALEAPNSAQISSVESRLTDEYRNDLLQRYGLRRPELEALQEEGIRGDWIDSPRCRVDPEAIYGIGFQGLPPMLLEPIAAAYTEAACDERVEGVTILQLVVGAEGEVRDAEILKGVPFGLGEMALEAAEGSLWLPALLCGQPVSVRYTVTVDHRLPPACFR